MRENSLILRFLYKILDSKGPPKPFFRPSVLRPIVEILVFGAGAMGSFFGGILSRRHGVTLVGRSEHVEAIRAHGLRITGKFVATKAYDTANAMLALERFADRSIFITLQNGLGNAETIAKTAHRVVAGTTAIGVTYVGPGEIRHAGVGDTVLGAWAHMGEADLVRLRDVLAEAGLVAQIASDIRTELWSKLVVNASLNPLAAIAGVANGRLVRDKRLAAVVEGICREATAVAKAEGAHLDSEELRHRTILVAKRTAANRASMLQDLDRHRKTEIEAITGSVVRAAARHRIQVPLNNALYAIVRAREAAT